MPRWIAFTVLIGIVLSVAVACSSEKSTSTATVEKPEVTRAPGSSPTKAAPPVSPTVKELTYEIVERWDIPNGGQGKAIVISPDYLNDADMSALGEKLKYDTKGDRNAFILVFDKNQAAALRQQVLNDQASEADLSLYDQHYVGQYTKNGNTGFHQFTIYFDGVAGTNQKTIQY